MCSRFETELAAVLPDFDIEVDDETLACARWGEIRPTDPALVLTYDRTAIVRRWGLMPDWATRPVINAKSEEAQGKRTFAPLLQSRCVIPATAYYEWRIDGGAKIKTRIAADRSMAIAGLADDQAFVLFTCAPAPAIAHIHHRMPAILPSAAIGDWLDPDADFAEVRHLLRPFPDHLHWTDAPRPIPRQGSLF